MPTLSSMILPPPEGWQEFERITQSALKIKWQSPNLTRHGRPGQEQQGVDIYGPDDLERFAGVQCKNTTKKLSFAIIEDEVKNAEAFTDPPLGVLYIATTYATDAKLQKRVRRLSAERVEDEQFPVGIFFWDDLVQELVKNKDEFKKHYPQFKLADDADNLVEGFRKLSIFDITYYGLYLRRYLELILGEIGQFAGEDPMGYRSVLQVVEGCSLVLFDHKRAQSLAAATTNLTNFLYGGTGGAASRAQWKKAHDMARRIEGIVAELEHRLTGSEQAMYRLGQLIGDWEANDGPDGLNANGRKKLLGLIQAALPGPIPDRVRQEIETSTKEGELRFTARVCDAVRGLIIDREIEAVT